MAINPPDQNMNEPEPEDLGSAWLQLMESDSDYLEEALGDNPKLMSDLMFTIHKLTYLPDSDINVMRISIIRDIVQESLEEYAAAKEEAGEELP